MSQKIVIIEDEIDISENIKEILFERGFEVYSSVNGSLGIQMIKAEKPDLIICDIMMPGISGFDVKKTLSLEPETATIPFIFLTAKVDPNDIRFGMNIGADDYILKPFKIKDLIDSIEARLKKAQMNKEALLKMVETEPNKKSKRYITINNSPDIIDTHKITYIESEGNYTHIYFSNKKKILVRKLIKDWENILPEEEFLRIHQSIIVSINKIEKIERISARNYTVKLREYESSLPISQRYSRIIKDKFAS